MLADDPGEGGDFVVFGPLSLMLVEPHQASLLRVIPKSAERTDIELVRIEAPDAKPPVLATDRADRLAEGLRQAGDAEAVMRSGALDRGFFAWYWSDDVGDLSGQLSTKALSDQRHQKGWDAGHRRRACGCGTQGRSPRLALALSTVTPSRPTQSATAPCRQQ